MAILEDLGLEVKVLVNNSPLQEYEDNDTESTDDGFGDEIRKCRRYVEVIGDTEFGVQFRVTPNSNYLNSNRQRLRFEIDLDDHEELRGFLLRSKGEPVLIEGQVDYDGQTYAMRKFRFATMSTVDDDDMLRVEKDKEIAGLLGLIRVRVWRAEVIESNLPGSPSQTIGFDETELQLAEKALKGKALSHRVTLSDAVPTTGTTYATSTFVDPVNVPLAVFYFKYRSKVALQEQLIIPRSREPSPQDILPIPEIDRLARLRFLGSKKGNNTSLERVDKRGPGEDLLPKRPRKIVKISGGREAIDLTEDD